MAARSNCNQTADPATEKPKCERTVQDLDIPADQREIVRRHLQLAGELRKLEELQDYLVDELYTKRRAVNRPKSHFSSEYAYLDEPHRKILFMGRKRYCSWNVFPCGFQCTLENALFRDAPAAEALLDSREEWKILNLLHVYYGQEAPNFIEYTEARKLNKNEWALYAPQNDLIILRRFRDTLIGFMMRAVAEAGGENLPHKPASEKNRSASVRRLRKELTRYIKISTGV